MAWVTIPTTDTDAESPLDTDLLTDIVANFAALAAGDSGAPAIQNAALDTNIIENDNMANDAIAQAELKTTNGTSTTTGGTSHHNMPGGEYGFQYEMKSSGGSMTLNEVKFFDAVAPGATYRNKVYVDINSAAGETFTIRQRYVQSSPPYDLGDGDVPLFIFTGVRSGVIENVWVAPDPPWANNGPTSIRSDIRDALGRKYKLVPRPEVTEEDVAAGRATPLEYKVSRTRAIAELASLRRRVSSGGKLILPKRVEARALAQEVANAKAAFTSFRRRIGHEYGKEQDDGSFIFNTNDVPKPILAEYQRKRQAWLDKRGEIRPLAQEIEDAARERSRLRDELMSFAVEIDQSVKQADMPLIPHPWDDPGNDLTGKEIVLLDPPSTLELLDLHEAGEDIADLIHRGLIELPTPVTRATPPGVLATQWRWRDSV